MYIRINYLLESNALPLMGDFWKIDAMEIQKTLNVVSDLIKRHNADLEERKSMSFEIYSLKSQIQELK